MNPGTLQATIYSTVYTLRTEAWESDTLVLILAFPLARWVALSN